MPRTVSSLAIGQGKLSRKGPLNSLSQGFSWYTTFTHWTHFFRWDSLASQAGIRRMAASDSTRKVTPILERRQAHTAAYMYISVHVCAVLPWRVSTQSGVTSLNFSPPSRIIENNSPHLAQIDANGEISADLEAQPREGDPAVRSNTVSPRLRQHNRLASFASCVFILLLLTPILTPPQVNGVVWPTVAEIAVVGGIGCGGFLLGLLLEELEQKEQYKYVVLQARMAPTLSGRNACGWRRSPCQALARRLLCTLQQHQQLLQLRSPSALPLWLTNNCHGWVPCLRRRRTTACLSTSASASSASAPSPATRSARRASAAARSSATVTGSRRTRSCTRRTSPAT